MTGRCFGDIPLVDAYGHRFHYWGPRGAWGHYPHHCPTCQLTIYPQGVPAANPQRHRDCDGHLVIWTGDRYSHDPINCQECQQPVNTDLLLTPIPAELSVDASGRPTYDAPTGHLTWDGHAWMITQPNPSLKGVLT